MNRKLNLGILIIVLTFTSFVKAAKLASLEVQNLADTVHMEFFGYDNWSYDIKRSQKGGKNFVEILVPTIDKASAEKLKKIAGNSQQNLIKSINIEDNVGDGKQKIVIEAANPNVDLFDYLTDQPSRLIIDVFVNNTVLPKIKTAVPSKKVAGGKGQKKPLRVPASTDLLTVVNDGPLAAELYPKTLALYDGADPKFERFAVKDFEVKDNAKEVARQNIYLDFPVLKLGLDEIQGILSQKQNYEVKLGDSDESKQAQLLMTLYTKNRPNVFLKTLNWFKDKFPDSKYIEMFSYMSADLYYDFWKKDHNLADFDKALNQYHKSLNNFPESRYAPRAQLLIPYMNLERGDYLAALKEFQSYSKHQKNPHLSDLANYASADIFQKLSKFEDAKKLYKLLEVNTTDRALKVESACNIGDISFQQKDYDKALATYQEIEKKYTDVGTYCPNLYFNKAAAFFKTENYRKSLDAYREFLMRFPKHEYAGFAMSRIGEDMEILGVDKNRALGVYLETYFRYGDQKSSIVARIRMLGSRIKNMKPKEIETSVEEIFNLAKDSELPKAEEFSNVMVADAYNSRDEYQKGIDLLVNYYQQNPTNPDKEMLSRRIVNYVNNNLNALSDAGKFLDVFKFQQKYSDTWLKNTDRVDTKYFLAKSYAQAGAFKESESQYKDAINKLVSLRGTAKEKTMSVEEHAPSLDQLYLGLAKVYSEQNKLPDSYEALKSVKSPEKLSEPDQIDRVSLSVQLLDKRGDLNTAVKYLTDLIKEWQGKPALEAKPYLQLAQFEKRQNKLDEALLSLQKISDLKQDGGNVEPEIHAKSLELKGEIELSQGKKEAAIKTYESLLSQYETVRPLASIRYKTGLLYFQKGDLQKASDTWQALKADKNDLWYNLAQENLKNSDWNNEYKRYIKRIPAMSETN